MQEQKKMKRNELHSEKTVLYKIYDVNKLHYILGGFLRTKRKFLTQFNFVVNLNKLICQKNKLNVLIKQFFLYAWTTFSFDLLICGCLQLI